MVLYDFKVVSFDSVFGFKKFELSVLIVILWLLYVVYLGFQGMGVLCFQLIFFCEGFNMLWFYILGLFVLRGIVFENSYMQVEIFYKCFVCEISNIFCYMNFIIQVKVVLIVKVLFEILNNV